MYTCRFFPSGIVVLTGGADMQLKVWSAETGQCAATMIGHRAGKILHTCIIFYNYCILSFPIKLFHDIYFISESQSCFT